MIVNDKRTMYDLLSRGAFGNTIPQYSLEEWCKSEDSRRYFWWGVRTKTPGGPCRLNCPKFEVYETSTSYRAAGHEVNVSVMIDRIVGVTLWAEVYLLPGGLGVYGIEYPPHGGSWREGMPYASWRANRGHWEGTAARLLLRRHLNENSLDDLYEVMEKFPDHYYEFSAVDRCFGTVPHRNAVIWEVRAY